MSRKVKAALQYALILGITITLVWISLRAIKGAEEHPLLFILSIWRAADKGWLWAMAGLSVVSFVVRAERWKMLLEPTGARPAMVDCLVSLMVGYLVNLAVPRGGEVSRCYNLYKLDEIRVETSFGTVIVERAVDVVCLLLLILIAFVLEQSKLRYFFEHLSWGSGSRMDTTWMWVILLVVVLAAGAVVVLLRRNQRFGSFIRRTWTGFREGLLAAFRVKRKGLFVVYSLAIWILYFLMSFTVVMAFRETSGLGTEAVLVLFAVGSIAMAMPLPGGTGAYHTLVPACLVLLFAVPKPDAVAFAFVFHGWLTLQLIVGGAVSLLATSLLVPLRRRQRQRTTAPE